MRMSPKQNNDTARGSSNTSQIQQKLFMEKSLGSRWSPVSGMWRLFHLSIVGLPIHHHTPQFVCLKFLEKLEKQTRDSHCSPWQCELSHIGSIQRLIDRPKLNTQWLFFIPAHRKCVANEFRSQKMLLKRSETMFWRCFNRSGKTNTNDCRTSKHSEYDNAKNCQTFLWKY